MDSHYSFASFAFVLFSIILMLAVIPWSCLFLYRRQARLHHFILLAVGTFCWIAFSIIHLCPWPQIGILLLSVSLVGIPIVFYLGFIMRKLHTKNELREFGDWLIDTLRESLIILDDKMQTLSCDNPLLPPWFFPAGRTPYLARLGVNSPPGMEALATSLKSGLPGEGTISYGDLFLAYRFIHMTQGWLLTLLDITEETLLVQRLQIQSKKLEQHKASILAMTDSEIAAREARYRQELSERIQDAVEQELRSLQTIMENNISNRENLTMALAHAEAGMSGIRKVVSQLAKDTIH